jgi:hypothetical protein
MVEYLTATMFMEMKTERAYLRLLFYIRRFGSANAKVAHHIAGCSRGYWNKHAWPNLDGLFEIRAGRIVERKVERLASRFVLLQGGAAS